MENAQFGMLGFGSGETNERNPSWFDWSLTGDVSPDGKNLVFAESGEGVGANYGTFMPGDGRICRRSLGEGAFPSFSPDAKWVAALNNASPAQTELLPTGAGRPRLVTTDSLEHLRVGWVPPGKAIVFSASEPNHAQRTYWMNLEDGKTRAITPEGTNGTLVSPDGKYLLAADPERRRWLHPLEGGDPQPLSADLENDDALIDWERDGKRKPGIPAKVVRVYLHSSRREDVRTVSPSDP